MVRGVELHAAAGAATADLVDLFDQSLDGRRGNCVERNGGVELGCTGRRRADRAIEQPTGRGQRARERDGAGQQLHRDVCDRDIAGVSEHDGHHHRRLQRDDENGDVDGDARWRASGDAAESGGGLIGGGRLGRPGGGRVVDRCASVGAAVSLSSSNPGVASVPATVTVLSGNSGASFSISTTAVSASTTVTITGTYNGTTRRATITVTPPAPPPQTATLTVSATGRSGETVVSSPAGINVATGSSGSASFASGTAITLSVSNGRDAIWSGACSSGGNKTRTCTFTLSGTATVTANVQ